MPAALRQALRRNRPWLIVATVDPGSPVPHVPEHPDAIEAEIEFRLHVASAARNV